MSDYYCRSIVALILILCGCASAIWGVRKIGRADWRWLLAGLLIAECGAFIWLRGWPWTWF